MSSIPSYRICSYDNFVFLDNTDGQGKISTADKCNPATDVAVGVVKTVSGMMFLFLKPDKTPYLMQLSKVPKPVGSQLLLYLHRMFNTPNSGHRGVHAELDSELNLAGLTAKHGGTSSMTHVTWNNDTDQQALSQELTNKLQQSASLVIYGLPVRIVRNTAAPQNFSSAVGLFESVYDLYKYAGENCIFLVDREDSNKVFKLDGPIERIQIGPNFVCRVEPM